MKQKWHVDELVEAWTLDEADLGLVRNKTGSTRLGFAVLLKFFELEARFPTGVDEVPIEVVDFVAGQLGVDLSQWRDYKFAGASWKRHRSQIRGRYGFRGWAMTDVEPLTEALQLRIATSGTDRDRLRLSVLEWCRQSRIEPPVADQLDRFVGSAVFAWESRTAQQVTDRLGLGGVERIEALLGLAMKDQLSALRTDPGAVGVETVLAELDKLDVLRRLELPAGLFDGVSAHSMNRWYERFAVTRPSALAEMAPADRVLLTAAWATERQHRTIDAIVDLLIAVIHKIKAKAEQRVEREFLADLRRVSGKTRLLYRIAEAALANPDKTIAEVVHPIAEPAVLQDLVEENLASESVLRRRRSGSHLAAAQRVDHGRTARCATGASQSGTGQGRTQPAVAGHVVARHAQRSRATARSHR